MMPPMHDNVILRQPILVEGKPLKDDHGFPLMNEIPILARVVEESTVVVDDQGRERQATFTVMIPPNVTPGLGDEMQIGNDTVVILKRKPRKSYSGRKVYYWVTHCG